MTTQFFFRRWALYLRSTSWTDSFQFSRGSGGGGVAVGGEVGGAKGSHEGTLDLTYMMAIMVNTQLHKVWTPF